MKCSEIQDWLSAYFDHELTIGNRAEVESHLADCNECQTDLALFASLRSLTQELPQPSTPDSIWANIEQGLGTPDRELMRSADSKSMLGRPNAEEPEGLRAHPQFQNSRRRMFQYAAALAATLLLGFIGFELWMHGDHDHTEMVKAMEQVASEINLNSSTNLLLNKFGGSQVNYQEAFTQVGYRPVASHGMPEGYSVENVQILDMPCCKCTQTACRRPDNSRFFIFEHDNEATGWFEHRQSRQCNCGGKDCKVVELDNQWVATFEKDNRYVTLLGVRDQEEIELLISQFEDKS